MRTNDNVFIVWEMDAWNSYSSAVCMGVFSTKEEAVEAIVKHHGIPLEEFDGLTEEEANDQIRERLQHYSQTQGFTTNYQIEERTIDDWN